MIKPKSMLIAFIITGILVATMVVAGCTTSQNTSMSKTTDAANKYWEVNPKGVHSTIEWVDSHDSDKYAVYFVLYKVRIEEDNTTCYLSKAYESGGISCLKDVP